MGYEHAPGEKPPIDNLSNLVGNEGSYALARDMTAYVRDLFVGNNLLFPESEKRIRSAGEKLAASLSPPPIYRSRMIGFTMCLSFGLKMSQYSAGEEAYLASLEGIENLIAHSPDQIPGLVEPSYDRFLSHQDRLMLSLGHNLQMIAPGGYQVAGRNVISFALELADQYVYSRILTEQMDKDIAQFLTPPDAPGAQE